jgi:hypothetical protein
MLYSNDKFVKECLVAVIDILCPNNSNDMHAISLSHHTVTRHIDKLAADLLIRQLKTRSFKI